MKDTELRVILDKFKNNKYQILVSSAVVEEGFDVPDCKYIIQYNKIFTTISHIQASGRARSADATIFYFCNDPEEEKRKAAILTEVLKNPPTNTHLDRRPSSHQSLMKDYPFRSGSGAQ